MEPTSFPTLATLLSYCERQARIESQDYFEPGFAKPEQIAALASDRAKRRRQKKACFRAFPGRLASAEKEALIPGHYGRLEILPDGSPDFTACQYPALEIYGYLLSYLEATN